MDWNYIAGFFDAEGCINRWVDKSKGKNKHKRYSRSKLLIVQTSKNNKSKILYDFVEFLGYGRIYHRINQSDILCIAGIKEQYHFLTNIIPLSYVRKVELISLFNELKKHKLNHVLL